MHKSISGGGGGRIYLQHGSALTSSAKCPLTAESTVGGTLRRARQARRRRTAAKYKAIRSSTSLMFLLIRKRYKTRACLMLIAVCHSLYL